MKQTERKKATPTTVNINRRNLDIAYAQYTIKCQNENMEKVKLSGFVDYLVQDFIERVENGTIDEK